MQDHHTDSFGDSNPEAYKREMFRLYSVYLPEYNGRASVDAEEEFSNAEGHSIVNMSILLNDVIDKRIISVNYASVHDVIESLDCYIPFKCDATQDVYDESLTRLWKNMAVASKENITRHYFQAIKHDCLKNYGMVNSENMLMNIRESAYRVLRFALINDAGRFKTI